MGSYCDLSGRPWEVSSMWMNALSGGAQNMRDAGALPNAKPLSVRALYQLPGIWNPSITSHPGAGLVVLARKALTNVLCVLDDRKLVGERVITGAYQPHERETCPSRIISLNGQLVMVSPTADFRTTGIPHAQIALVALHRSDPAIVESVQVLHSDRYEKNWMPCVVSGGEASDAPELLRLVYSTDPLIVLDPPYETKAITKLDATLRGGSQLVPFKDGYLGIVHQAHLKPGMKQGTPRSNIYFSRFVRFNAALTAATIGEPWYIQTPGVEIVAGLVEHGDRFLISFGVNDEQAWIIEVSPDAIDETMRAATPVLDDPAQTKALARVCALLDEPAFSQIDGWCSPEKAKRMAALIAGISKRPVLAVELGVFGGRGVVAMGLALRDVLGGAGRVDGIDPYTAEAALEGSNAPENDAWWKKLDYAAIKTRARQTLDRYKLQGVVSLIESRSEAMAPTYADGSVDLLHLDANHATECSCRDVELWAPKMRPGGLVVFDDTDWETTRIAQGRLVAQHGFVRTEDHTKWAVFQAPKAPR